MTDNQNVPGNEHFSPLQTQEEVIRVNRAKAAEVAKGIHDLRLRKEAEMAYGVQSTGSGMLPHPDLPAELLDPNQRFGPPPRVSPIEQFLPTEKDMRRQMAEVLLGGTKQVTYFEDVAEELLEEAYTLLRKKRRDYGNQNLLLHGEYGIIVRTQDKISRLTNLVKSGAPAPEHESIEDTWIDIMNYGLLGLIAHRGQLDLPDRPNASRE